MTNLYPPHHYGGYELSCRDVVERWRRRGHRVTVLTSTVRVPGVPDVDEPDVHRRLQAYFRDGRPWTPGPWTRVRMERSNHAHLRRMLASGAFDVVSVWHMGALSTGLLTTLVRRGLPLVYVVCDDWLSYAPQMDGWMRVARRYPRAGGLVGRLAGIPTDLPDVGANGMFCFVSELTRERAERLSSWTYPDATVVYSGIDTADFPVASAPTDPPQWRWRLLSVGRLDPRKGVETAVRALAALPREATLTVAGRGDERERARLEKIAADVGVHDRVVFTTAERHELSALYAGSDALVFPVQWEEPFGLVPIEAMACQRPVVATCLGGSAEYLADDVNCLCVRPRDPDAVADALRRLARDPALRARLVDGGLRTARRLNVDRLADVLDARHQAAVEAAAARAAEDPLTRHRADAARIVPTGATDAIKNLYVELGASFERAHADDPDGIPVLSAPETHPVVERLLEGVDGPVLDAGCGPNPALSLALARARGRAVVSLDIGEGSVRVARTLAQRQGRNLLGVVGDVEALPFRAGTFGGVACEDTIEHVPHDDTAIEELARVLAPHGSFVLATPNRHSLRVLRRKLVDRVLRRQRPARAYFVSTSHLREYTSAEVERLVRPELSVYRRTAVGWGGTGAKRRVASLLVSLPFLRRFDQMVVVACRRREGHSA